MKSDRTVHQIIPAGSSAFSTITPDTNMSLIGFASVASLSLSYSGIFDGRMGCDHWRIAQIMLVLLIFQISNSIVVRMKLQELMKK